MRITDLERQYSYEYIHFISIKIQACAPLSVHTFHLARLGSGGESACQGKPTSILRLSRNAAVEIDL